MVSDAPPAPLKKDENPSAPVVPPKESVVVSPDTVTVCFRASTEKDPKNREYGQSLGFSCVPDYLDGLPHNGGSTVLFWEEAPHYKKEIMGKAVAAFEQVLSAKPRDFDTLYSLAMICVQSDSASAAAYLEKANQRQANNAALWYLLGEIQFRQADKSATPDEQTAWQKKGVAAIEKGNAAPDYKATLLPVPLPVWLRAAWKYRPVKGYGDDTRVLSILSTRAGDYLQKEDAANHTSELLRGASALSGMGLKAMNSVADDPALSQNNLYDLWQTGLAGRVLLGVVNVYKACDAVRESQKVRPDAQKARFLDKNAGLLEYAKSIDKEVTNSN